MNVDLCSETNGSDKVNPPPRIRLAIITFLKLSLSIIYPHKNLERAAKIEETTKVIIKK